VRWRGTPAPNRIEVLFVAVWFCCKSCKLGVLPRPKGLVPCSIFPHPPGTRFGTCNSNLMLYPPTVDLETRLTTIRWAASGHEIASAVKHELNSRGFRLSWLWSSAPFARIGGRMHRGTDSDERQLGFPGCSLDLLLRAWACTAKKRKGRTSRAGMQIDACFHHRPLRKRGNPACWDTAGRLCLVRRDLTLANGLARKRGSLERAASRKSGS